MLIALLVVWAMILGISPGLALAVIPITVLALDRYDSSLLDHFIRAWPTHRAR
jgi:hypothetical protein